MRTLNRPMFNMGGPIKQGIMHGIREPYSKAGVVKGIASKAGPIFKKAGELFKGRTKGWWPSRPQRVIGKHGWQENVARPNTWGIIGDTGKTTVKLGKDITGPVPFKGNKANWLKQWGKENPAWATAAGLATATTPNLAIKTVPSIAGAAGTIGKTWIDAVLPGDQSKWFTSEKIAEDLKPVITGEGAGLATTEDTSTAESRANFAKKQRDGRVQKYLDMMGYDRSKKTAIADALIDASKLVSDRGTLDTKNITGELINPAIQALSKRLDKPEQIREAVGLMMTKAGLEKEMYDAKPGVQLKAARDYQTEFGGSMANAYKQTGGTKKLGFTETKAALAKQYQKGVNDQNVLVETIKMTKANEPGFKVENIKILGDADMLEKVQADEDFVSITDSILQHEDANVERDGKIYAKPGIYIMGSVVLEVDETGIPKRLN